MVGAIAALRRRATEGGSYRVRVSLARVALWLLQMGIFDNSYASDAAGSPGDHAYPDPDLFEVETPCGHYQGVTDQVVMSGTRRRRALNSSTNETKFCLLCVSVVRDGDSSAQIRQYR
jgi:hypothetical protein